MEQRSNVFSDKNLMVPHDLSLETSGHGSGAILKASLIAPRDIIDGLPEELLRWLHDEKDCASKPMTGFLRAVELDFESVVVDRLFPLRDTRSFVRRLHLHSMATANAAAMLADLRGHSAKTAWVCGWLHDLGIAACLKHADEVVPVSDDAELAALWPAIERSSAQHGLRLASRWRLPSTVRHTIREHEGFVTLSSPSVHVAITHVAEHIATLIGYGYLEHEKPFLGGRALPPLQLQDRDVLAVAARTERLMRVQALRRPPAMRIVRGA